MGKTHFSGPIKAGPIQNTSGTTVGRNVKNVGDVVLSQEVAITQAGTTAATLTGIVIPANSQIIDIKVFATTAWSTGSNTLSLGTSVTANELVAATAVSAIGVLALTPGTDATRTGKWINVGTSDVAIYALSNGTGAGVGNLVVTYIQSNN